MRTEERELAAERLRQIADEVGLDASPERIERLVALLESTVDGVRNAGDLDADEHAPAFVPEIAGESA